MKIFKQLLFAFLFFNAFHLQAQSLEAEIVKAIKAAGNKQYDVAIAKYDSLIAEYPKMKMLYLLKGEAYSQLRRTYTVDTVSYNNAMRAYLQAIALDSTFFDAYRSMGLLNIYHQRFEKAAQYYTRAIEYAPNQEDLFNSYTDRGAAYLYLGKNKEAIADYNEAIKIRPDAPGVYSNLAMMHKRSGNLVEARKLCMKGLEIDGNNTTLKNNLGLINLDEKKYAEAESIFEQILVEDPNDPIALSNVGFARTNLEKYELAMQNLDRSIQIYPENSYAFKNRAILKIRLDKKQDACKDLVEAKRLGYTRMYGTEVDDLLETHCEGQ
ncbi:MAG: tetratricopeptide repeat protein [Bacteroidota bacterium]